MFLIVSRPRNLKHATPPEQPLSRDYPDSPTQESLLAAGLFRLVLSTSCRTWAVRAAKVMLIRPNSEGRCPRGAGLEIMLHPLTSGKPCTDLEGHHLGFMYPPHAWGVPSCKCHSDLRCPGLEHRAGAWLMARQPRWQESNNNRCPSAAMVCLVEKNQIPPQSPESHLTCFQLSLMGGRCEKLKHDM